MTKQSEIIIAVAVVVLLGGGIAFWVTRKLPPVPTRIANAASKSPVPVPAAPPVQFTTTPSVTPAAQRRFVDLDVLEANGILMKIKEQDLAVILQTMLDAGRVEHDLTKQLSIGTVFEVAMKERPPSPELLEKMRLFIMDDRNTIFERQLVLGVMGNAQRKETLAIVLELLPVLSEKELKQSIVRGLGNQGVATGRGRVENHEDLSPLLEGAWRKTEDEVQLVYLSKAIVEVGAASGVDLLLNSALSEKDSPHRRTAGGAFVAASIFNANAVPPLAAHLAKLPPGSGGSRLITDALARMVMPEAAKALVNWFQNADSSVASRAHNYIVRSSSLTQLKAWESALNPAVSFRSEKNREAIRDALAERQREEDRMSGRGSPNK